MSLYLVCMLPLLMFAGPRPSGPRSVAERTHQADDVRPPGRGHRQCQCQRRVQRRVRGHASGDFKGQHENRYTSHCE